MELHPIDVDRCSHSFMNSIPYPKGSFNVLISRYGTFFVNVASEPRYILSFYKRGIYADLRQGQSVSCQSKILPRCHNSLSAYSVPSESCWGVPSPNPAVTACAAVVPLAYAAKIYFSRWLRFLKKMSIER